MSDIVYNPIFLKDINDYSAMNLIYEAYFQKNPPARWGIRGDLVKPEFLVEISSIAHVD
jgi:aminoacrylate peracid reductase